VALDRPRHYEPYLIVASAPAHCPRYWLTDASRAPGSWLSDFLFLPGQMGLGFEIGNRIDESTGGCCAVSPNPITGTLAEEGAVTGGHSCAEQDASPGPEGRVDWWRPYPQVLQRAILVRTSGAESASLSVRLVEGTRAPVAPECRTPC